MFAWLEIGDNLTTEREHAAAQAKSAAQPFLASLAAASREANQDWETAQVLGIQSIQLIGPRGEVMESFGVVSADSVSTPEAMTGSRVKPGSYDVRFSDDGFVPQNLSPLNMLLGGEFGSAHVFVPPLPLDSSLPGRPPLIRVVLSYESISQDARILVLRAAALAGGILAVAALTIWFLLHRFVARPLAMYNTTARAIADGEDASMPDLGAWEFAQLGQTIDDMAAALRRQASVDALTGLYNLRDMRGRLPALLKQSIERQQPLALVAADLDNLKPVNDTHGHPTGDRILSAIANELRQWAGEGCVCWRTGGDEFVVALPGTSRAVAEARTEELDQLVRIVSIEAPGGSAAVSMSIGVASYPEDGQTVDALMSMADARMYETKSTRAGRGLAKTG